MIQILLERQESLDGLKEEVMKSLQSLSTEKKAEEFGQVAERLHAFIDVYKATLSEFLDGQKTKLTFAVYQEHMKDHDEELRFLCNQYTFLKSEMLENIA